MPANLPNHPELSERKYQVFISSTFRDLAIERRKALDVIIDRGHMPIALERYGPDPTAVTAVVEQAIRQSQVYLLILGHRYGELVEGRDISYSKLEFDWAVENGLVVLVLALNERQIVEKRKALELVDGVALEQRKRNKAELRNTRKLLEFHSEAKRRGGFWVPFNDTDDRFHWLVHRALENGEKKARERNIPGWIKEPKNIELAEALQALQGNPFLIEIVHQFRDFEKLDVRCKESKDEKEILADFFARKYEKFLLDSETRLFFESGSTVAYVARAMGSLIHQRIRPTSGGEMNIEIKTNNILAYLQLWLIHGIPCAPFPYSAPEQVYGASYGTLEDDIPKDPLPEPGPLSKTAEMAIDKLMNIPFSPAKWKTEDKPTLLLGATSGFQFGDPYNGCLGPHVGSYKNKLFKRFMYKTGHPIMIFLTSGKIDSPVKDECHFVLDDAAHWNDFKKSHPVAFGIGCSTKQQPELVKDFEAKGFSVIRRPQSGEHTAFIARNQKFIESFEARINFDPQA